MKLETLASKPQLIKIIIDDEDIVSKYGEAVEFHVYDRQDMDTFMSLASMKEDTQFGEIAKVVAKLVLDEKGNPVLEDGEMLPMDLTVKTVEKVVAHLGNSMTQTSAN
jgi:hypothetical protein